MPLRHSALALGRYTGIVVAELQGMKRDITSMLLELKPATCQGWPYALLAAALATVFFVSSSSAAPRAQSAEECGIAADMAIVAKSLAREEIQLAKAGAIMARIYDVTGSDRGKALMKEILDAAYRRSAGAPQKFAEELYVACMQSGGDMDVVLGERL